MDRNRKSYVEATDRLVSFLDEVTAALQSQSPGHRKLVESTKAEVSRVARKAANARLYNGKKQHSLDPAVIRISKAESMPGNYS
jgi:predicted phage tail protein